jgi:phenylalanyl-tRNA synthetase beta chain
LQPSLARQLDARAPVLIAEFELGAHPDSECLYRPIPPYPSSVRDIAILAPLQLPFSNVERAIRDAREPLLTSVHLFDVFHDPTGVRLAADARSLAISLTFAAHDRTLQAVEVQEATDRIKQHLKDQLGVGFRE